MTKRIACDIANVLVEAFRSGYCTIPHLDVHWRRFQDQWIREECVASCAEVLSTDEGGTPVVAILKRGALNRKDERRLFQWIKVSDEKEAELGDGDTALFWGHRSMALKHGNASVCCYTKREFCACSNLPESEVSLFALSFSLSPSGRDWIDGVKKESIAVIESGKVFDFGKSVSRFRFHCWGLVTGEGL